MYDFIWHLRGWLQEMCLYICQQLKLSICCI